MSSLNKRVPEITSILVAVTGLLIIVSTIARRSPIRVNTLNTVHIVSKYHLIPMGIGLVLIYLSGEIRMRKSNAYWFLVACIGLLITDELFHHHHKIHLLLYAGILAIIISIKKYFVVRSDAISMRRGVTLAIAQLITVSIVCIGIYTIIDQREFGRNISGSESLSITIDSILGSNLPSSINPSLNDHLLIITLQMSLLVAIIIIFYSILRPLKLTSKATKSDRIEAEKIIKKYSNSPEDFFKTYPQDKHYYFYQDSLVAFAVDNGIAVVLDGAIGNSNIIQDCRRSFVDFCQINGWRISIIHCDKPEAESWEKLGLKSIVIGSEALIDISNFMTEQIKNKHFRYVKNKAVKDGLSVDYISRPIKTETINKLRDISEQWLSRDRREYKFIMAPFNTEYIKNCDVAVLKQNEKIVAYVNIIPAYDDDWRSIDHMRFASGTSGVAMHFLILQLIINLNENNVKILNLGLAPLSKIDNQPQSIVKYILRALKQLGNRYYSFSGVEQFKGKFAPQWSNRYITYSGGSRTLITLARALTNISSITTKNSYPKWIMPAVGISALLYSSFILAPLLNGQYFINGLVSALGQRGQPYSWLFNVLDIISGLLLSMVLFWVLKHKKTDNKLLLISTWALLINSIGIVLAALIPLPTDFQSESHLTLLMIENPFVISHGIGSFVNSAGLFTAALCYLIYCKQIKHFSFKTLLAIVIIFVATFGFIIGYSLKSSGPTLQRIYILSSSLFVYLLIYYLVNNKPKNPL